MNAATAPVCSRCGAPLGVLSAFCGACGARAVAVAAALDAEPLGHLEVGAQGLLRVRVTCLGASVDDVEVRLTIGPPGAASGAVALPTQSTGPLATGASAVVALAWTPPIAGFHELAGELRSHGVTLLVSPEHLRVGAERQPVSITIDQSHARVVDNSRSTFGVGPSGGLLGDGDWRPLGLAPVAPKAAPQLPPRPAFAPVAFAVTTGKTTWEVTDTVARGDLATIYAARERGAAVLGGREAVVKLVDDRADNDLAQLEVEVLTELARDPGPTPSPTAHFPVVLDRFKAADGRVGTVLERLDGMDLVELRRRLADRGEPGLHPRHAIWLLRRALAALGWAHARGILHGNLDPAHILVRPRDHMVWVVDWCWAVVNPARTGQGFKAKNEVYSPPEVAERKPPLPASDLYALGKCVIFALGGDPADKSLPDHPDLDERLARFLKWMVNDSPRGRPQDALALYLQVEKLREQIWGPHTFVPLDV